ncbi:uncharacterized protein BP5553_05125 [Venustampulla echinocandica]|uniref:Nephrocystin 3-like N-terminal domain-containing protein n=1 Tax=Venustampulla echinocandica TaxID=2656787 RepID=A0A370TQA4_9HELO|nr:uncharacterized protein BP5553_05125 [Venustampulla echinocandica]RDL37692.1 hypothetical protein BP5553_05125 [Venustampulla echinocandica]
METDIVTFIGTEAPKIDPAFGVPSHYDYQRATFGPRKPHHDLEEALLQYKKLKLTPTLDFDVENCSWEDVLDQMTKVKGDYEDRANGLKNTFRKVWRKMGDGDILGNINPLLDMIPNQYGLSVLRGGLAFIFYLAKKAAKKRDKIFSAFEDIPDVIARAMAKRELFPSHKRLRECSDKLYSTLLLAITHLIGYLLPKQAKQIFQNFKESLSETEIDGILGSVSTDAAALSLCAEGLLEAAAVETNTFTKKGDLQLQAIRMSTIDNGIKTQAVGRQLGGVEARVEALQLVPQKLDDMDRKIDELKQRESAIVAEATASGINGKNALARFLADVWAEREERQMRELELEERILDLERSRTPLPPSTAFITLPHLLEVLAVPLETSINDLESTLRQGREFDMAAQGQSRWLLQTEQFRRWFSSTRSELLLVDGNTDSADPGRISPMAFLSATLIASILKMQPQAISLYFFCGQHTSPSDVLRGPNGLMRSLVTGIIIELRRRGALSLDFINSRPYREALERQDALAICVTFQQLIKQLPLETPVYCIIGGISWLEKQEWLDDLYRVVDKFQELVSDEHLRPNFKVLMTSPHRSRFIYRRVSPQQRVFLQTGLIDNGLTSERFLLAGMRRPVSPGLAQFVGRHEADSNDDEWAADDYN